VVLAASSRCSSSPTAIVMWHGMGDICCNPLSMGYISKLLRTTLGSNLYVHSLMLGENVITDTEHGYFSNMNELVEEACAKIGADRNLSDGYDAIGFSQGGLFVRALAQRCPNPPIRNLISVGGPQQGIYGFPYCLGMSGICNAVRHLLNYGAYSSTVQRISVQAQYWHDPYLKDDYVDKSIFLADINCERVENLLLVKFLRDEMVVPKESEWFGFFADNNSSAVVNLEETPLYKEDWIGLKTLDKAGKLHYLAVDGQHLQIPTTQFVSDIIDKYLKKPKKKRSPRSK